MSSTSPERSQELEHIEQRRQLRKSYRELQEQLHADAELLGVVDSDVFENKHNKLNELFSNVDNIRELGIDADTLNELSHGVKTQATKLSDLSANFDFRYFVDSIRNLYVPDEAGGCFSWTALGRDCGALFSAGPTFNILLGSLNRDLKVRKKAERKETSTVAANQKPEEVNQEKTNDDAEEATNQRCQKLFTVMNKVTKDEGKVDLLSLLVDPDDPVQTVENLFDFSFLIKNKTASIEINEEDGDIAGKIENPMNWGDDNQKRQMVMALSMKDLKELGKLIEYSENSQSERKKRKSVLHRNSDVYK